MKAQTKYATATALFLALGMFLLNLYAANPAGERLPVHSMSNAACTDRACLAVLAPSTPGEAVFEESPFPAVETVAGNSFEAGLMAEPAPAWSGLAPMTPPEATFGDDADEGDTVLPSGLAPVTPAEADFIE